MLGRTKMTIDFKDKVAIVTGAGGGLGRSHALELSKRGAKVVVNDLGGSVDGSGGSSDAAEKVVKEIISSGGQAISNGSSVTDDNGVKLMIDQTIDDFYRFFLTQCFNLATLPMVWQRCV